MKGKQSCEVIKVLLLCCTCLYKIKNRKDNYRNKYKLEIKQFASDTDSHIVNDGDCKMDV